jgi:hypothetical protein
LIGHCRTQIQSINLNLNEARLEEILKYFVGFCLIQTSKK